MNLSMKYVYYVGLIYTQTFKCAALCGPLVVSKKKMGSLPSFKLPIPGPEDPSQAPGDRWETEIAIHNVQKQQQK